MRSCTLAALCAWSLLLPSLAWAQGSIASQERTVTGGTLMLLSYLALWILIFGFVAKVLLAQRSLERDLAGLERRMDQLVEPADAPSFATLDHDEVPSP